MPGIKLNDKNLFLLSIFCWLIFLSSCAPFVRNAPKGQAFLYENRFEVKGGNLTKSQKGAIKQRIAAQLDDSSTLKKKDKYIFLHYVVKPPVYDSNATIRSAKDMKSSLFHIGYYNATVTFNTDTIKKNNGHQQRIRVTYTAEPGPPTIIDTVRYSLKQNEFQSIALSSKADAFLKENDIISKAGVLSEINRLVDSFRNNGYYKFTASELRVRGDTTIEALTSVTEDPFEQLRLLTLAQEKKDSPKIKIAVVLVPPADSSKLSKFYIHKVFVLSDFRAGDNFSDTSVPERKNRNFTERYHERLFRTRLLTRSITLKPGDLYRQTEYSNTLYNLSKLGVWQNVNIQMIEVPGDSSFIDVIIELIPAKKFGFQAALEASYSASTNASSVVSGNLFGISGNLSLLNRNLAKEGIRMTHNIRAGIELNNNTRGSKSQLINSNELGYTNTIALPLILNPFRIFVSRDNRQNNNNQNSIFMKQVPGETFVSTDLSYNNRLNLFNLQSFGFNFGYTIANKQTIKKPKWNWTIRPLFLGFSNLYNETDSFRNILKEYPFLRYSYNTAFVMGTGVSVYKIKFNTYHPNSELKERSIRINAEESGVTWGRIPVMEKYKRNYVKADVEYRYTVKYKKTALAYRFFLGAGLPLLGSDSNRTLPFFKQYYGGGSMSMRGWPVRGIGPGGRPAIPFSSNKTIFNDRTGDMQIETNFEYRYDIARIIPNALTLRGALFVDAGNIWNVRNTKTDGTADSSQFLFNKAPLKQLYQQLGLSAGTGFRLDFNYLVLRFDLGFRFKRPERYYINDGWKAPSIGFNDALKKIFTRGANQEYRKWRYENFNFTIGIGYAF